MPSFTTSMNLFALLPAGPPTWDPIPWHPLLAFLYTFIHPITCFSSWSQLFNKNPKNPVRFFCFLLHLSQSAVCALCLELNQLDWCVWCHWRLLNPADHSCSPRHSSLPAHFHLQLSGLSAVGTMQRVCLLATWYAFLSSTRLFVRRRQCNLHDCCHHYRCFSAFDRLLGVLLLLHLLRQFEAFKGKEEQTHLYVHHSTRNTFSQFRFPWKRHKSCPVMRQVYPDNAPFNPLT